MIVIGDGLDLDGYWRVVVGHEAISVDPALLRRGDQGRTAMERHLGTGATAYGVTTGLGYFADRAIPPPTRRRCNARSSAGGPPASARRMARRSCGERRCCGWPASSPVTPA